MKKQIIRTERAPSSPLYAQGVKVGSTIYVAGMIGMDPVAQRMAGATIEEQVPVARTFPLAAWREALAISQSWQARGKLVLLLK